jgi:hypothetical protein
VGVVPEWAAQCHGVDTGLPAQLPYSARDGLTGRVGGTATGYDSQAVSEDWSWRGFAFDPGARGVPEHLMLWSGGVGAGVTCPGQPPERGGESPEGALGPRARWRIARGVSRPVGWWAVMVSLGRGLPALGCDHR